MPHKRNPVLSENLCGLARMVRAYVLPALENVALWHERDISHSSAERMIAPDATSTLAFMLDRAASVVEGLVVYPGNLKKNLERSGGLFFSEAVLLLLVEKGLARQQAYVMVQRAAMKAIEGMGTFQANLAENEEVARHASPGELSRCFDLDHALRYVDEVIARARR